MGIGAGGVRVPCGDMPLPVTLAVVGAGSRGAAYARWAARHPDRARVVAVAEPHPARRDRLADEHRLPCDGVFDDWRAMVADGRRLADAVLIGTPDREHVEPAAAFAAAGYDILLEPPMAHSEAGCRRLVAAVERAGVLFAVGRPLRHGAYTDAVREIVADGRLGDVLSVQHLAPAGFRQQAHAFVRGPGGRADRASGLLLARSGHDLDWLTHVLGEAPVRVSSFGRLSHFTPAHRPAGAADRCLDCAVEPDCPYSAKRFYFNLLVQGEHGWPLDAVVEEPTAEALGAALRHGPYGRCVYDGDNDVLDHQVVSMEFGSGVTGTLTVTGGSVSGARRTRIFGSHAELSGDGDTIRLHDFLTGATSVLRPAERSAARPGGHGAVLDAFVRAVAGIDPPDTGPRDALASHLAVFAAERARQRGTVEAVPPPLELIDGAG